MDRDSAFGYRFTLLVDGVSVLAIAGEHWMRRFLIVLLAGLAAPGAQAACFENLGQTGCTDSEVFPTRDLRRLSCENLWLVRNTIYSENGYCFRTDRALRYFDNSGCHVDDAEEVKMNAFERANRDRIVGVERRKGCR